MPQTVAQLTASLSKLTPGEIGKYRKANPATAGLKIAERVRDADDRLDLAEGRLDDLESVPVHATLADITALKAVASADRADRVGRFVESVNDVYWFDADSSATGDDMQVVTPNSGTGRWFKQGPVNYTSDAGATDDVTNKVFVGKLRVNTTTDTVAVTTDQTDGAAVHARLVNGPASTTDNFIPAFDGTTGQKIKSPSTDLNANGQSIKNTSGLFTVTETADGSIGARRLVAIDSSGDHVEAGVNALNVVGINAENAAKIATNSMEVAYGGKVTGIAVDIIDEGMPLKSYFGGRVGEMVGASKTGTTIEDNVGLAFVLAGQPQNDGLEIVSDNAGDTQNATIYGTTTGTDTVVKETIALNGVGAVSTVKVNWGFILGIELSSAAVGTITFREASGNVTVIEIAPAASSIGVIAVPAGAQRAFGVAPTVVAEGATTKVAGFVGTAATDGSTELLQSKALNGTTPVTFDTAAHRVTKLLVGDVEATRTATFKVGAAESLERKVGKSIGAAAALADPVSFNLQP